MTSQTHNDLPQIANNNVIKIPYSDNQEESLIDTSIHINGFTIIELDEEKKDYLNLIPSYEEDQIIGKKQKIQLESKARNVENYYSVYQDDVVPNVNCSRCLLSNFTSNDLLYFKDRKTLILYLKYCFIYLKRSIFMNHFLYMKNKNELNKINQSFYSGWKFLIPKTICKACFIQIINMEYLISNIKNIICDYYGTNTISPPPQAKIPNLLNNKRKRVISKNKRKKITIQKEIIHLDDKTNDINTQITPIVIPIPETVKIKKKKRRSTSTVFKKRKIKNFKKNNKKKYNENIIYDDKNNILIINKKCIGNYQVDEDSLIINKIINDNKKNTPNKEKEKENANQNNKKDEKLKFISRNKTESDSLTNKKIIKKEKKNEININENKDINDNKNKNNSNKNNIQKNTDKKNTIIINNFNNNNSKSDEINMNKVGLIQINNNQFENNNLNNYSNNDFNMKNNLKQNNNNILINNLNNNNNFSNYFNHTNISIIKQLFVINKFINPMRLKQDIYKLYSCIINLSNFSLYILQNLRDNNISNKNQYINLTFLYLAKIDDIRNIFNETECFLDYSINIIRANISIFQNLNISNNNNYNYNELFAIINYLDDNSKIMKYKYNELIRTCMIICNYLKQTIEAIVSI